MSSRRRRRRAWARAYRRSTRLGRVPWWLLVLVLLLVLIVGVARVSR